ncbi:MAG: diaminopimelate decarboxylase [Bacillota bacterium]|nr:diaminopimelate decarboxylase [Bacillota bacterium]
MTLENFETKRGHLFISGVDTCALAEKYGTPLYVMSEDIIRKNCKSLKETFEKYYDSKGLITYASKAFCCKEMCRIIADEGLGLDVVSGGELYTAHEAGFPMGKINFHGNNKTDEEIELGIQLGVGRFVIDNISELRRVNDAAKKHNVIQNVLIRITPGVEAHTHEFIKTGQIDSKFGAAIQTGAADEICDYAMTLSNISLEGFHCHIGSQIFEANPFIETAEIMLKFIKDTEKRLNTEFSELVLGGGFGIKYVDSDEPLEPGEILKDVLIYIKDKLLGENKKLIKLGFEPGRSIAGPAGITLYKVGSVKEIPGIRTYVSVDGGMTDNPRYILYGAEYRALIASKADDKKDKLVTIAGKCCESGDIVAKDVYLGDVKEGDILSVFATGAYNYSMASNYNRIPKPAVVMVKNGSSRVIIERESFKDMCRRDF